MNLSEHNVVLFYLTLEDQVLNPDAETKTLLFNTQVTKLNAV